MLVVMEWSSGDRRNLLKTPFICARTQRVPLPSLATLTHSCSRCGMSNLFHLLASRGCFCWCFGPRVRHPEAQDATNDEGVLIRRGTPKGFNYGMKMSKPEPSRFLRRSFHRKNKIPGQVALAVAWPGYTPVPGQWKPPKRPQRDQFEIDIIFIIFV